MGEILLIITQLVGNLERYSNSDMQTICYIKLFSAMLAISLTSKHYPRSGLCLLSPLRLP